MALTKVTYSMIQGAVLNVQDFGAVGDGVTDDTAAIQAAVNAVQDFPQSGTTIFFPECSAFYRITSTVNIGIFSVSANNNVNGFAQAKYGLTLDLNAQVIRWDGADQPGSTIITVTDSVGTYPLITDCNPMFSVVAAKRFTVRNGVLNGLSIDGLRRAYTCIWTQGNGNQHRYDNLETYGARIGHRTGCSWDLVTNTLYWGYADSPYYKANVNNAVAVGGWQIDTQAYTTVSFSGTLAHYSCESAQNLGITINSALLGNDVDSGPYGFILAGGRITCNGISFLRASTYDFWMPFGTNSFTATDHHSESAATVKFRTTTAATNPNLTLINSDAAYIQLPGGGVRLTIIDSNQVNIIRSDVNARADITVISSTVVGLSVANTADRTNVNIKLQNCLLSASILTGATASNCYVAASNCSPMGNLPLFAGAFDTSIESFNGQTHYCKARKTLPHNTATVVGSIDTATVAANSSGTCLLRVNYSSPYTSAASAGVFGLYSFAYSKDSGSVITLSAVSVINEIKALDGYSTYVPTVTVGVSTSLIQISISLTNDLTLDSLVDLQAEVYVGGNSQLALTPVWISA